MTQLQLSWRGYSKFRWLWKMVDLDQLSHSHRLFYPDNSHHCLLHPCWLQSSPAYSSSPVSRSIYCGWTHTDVLVWRRPTTTLKQDDWFHPPPPQSGPQFPQFRFVRVPRIRVMKKLIGIETLYLQTQQLTNLENMVLPTYHWFDATSQPRNYSLNRTMISFRHLIPRMFVRTAEHVVSTPNCLKSRRIFLLVKQVPLSLKALFRDDLFEVMNNLVSQFVSYAFPYRNPTRGVTTNPTEVYCVLFTYCF